MANDNNLTMGRSSTADSFKANLGQFKVRFPISVSESESSCVSVPLFFLLFVCLFVCLFVFVLFCFYLDLYKGSVASFYPLPTRQSLAISPEE